MSQHSQNTQEGPSRAFICAMSALVLASAAATGYTISGPVLSGPDVAGFLLGVVLTGLLAGYTATVGADFAVARNRALRAAETERARLLDPEESQPVLYPHPSAEEVQRWLREHDEPPLTPPMYPDSDLNGRAWTQAWRVYEENHPEVLASWGKQNGRWPNCRCVACRPDLQERTRGPEPSLEYEADPQRPWRAFEPSPVPVPPRGDPDSTEVFGRVRDEGETEVIDRVR